MEEVFKKFAELYKTRNSRISTINMGEDSIRYDFFLALLEVKNLKNYEIQIEAPIIKESFVPRNNPLCIRNEKPLIDLIVSKEELKLCVEFGLFKQNSNPNGSIDKTDRIGKMINDMIRVGLHSHFTKSDAYFICVADRKILGHKLDSGVFDPFPAETYLLNHNIYFNLPASAKSRIDTRFISKQRELNIIYEARLIFSENIETTLNSLETKILIWKILTQSDNKPS